MNTTYRPAALFAVCCALLLCGCAASPQYHYYVLGVPDFSPPTGEGPPVGVGPVEVAEYLAGDDMVYRSGGNELQVSRSGRWAEPLSEGIARVLELNLARELDTQDLRRYPWSVTTAPPIAVQVRVLELDAMNGQAFLVAEWLLYRPRGEVLKRRISRLETTLDSAVPLPGALAPAYSELLAQLSADLARELRAASDTADAPIAGTVQR